MTFGDFAVMIPPVKGYLDKTNPRFGEAPGQKALAPKGVGRLLSDTVEIERGFGFRGKIDQARRFGLHAEGQLERFNDALHLTVGLEPFQLPAVHGLDEVDATTLSLFGK